MSSESTPNALESQSVDEHVRQVTVAMKEGQQHIQTKTRELATKVEKVINNSEIWCKEIKRLELEAASIVELEEWISITSSELSHLKSQISFIKKFSDGKGDMH